MHSIRRRLASLVAWPPPPAPPWWSARPASAAGVTTVKAVETDFHIALSKTPSRRAGTPSWPQNKGQTTHALMISGPGIKMAMTKDISPGQSAKLTVTLKKGAYDIDCPIPGHKALGMNVEHHGRWRRHDSPKTAAGQRRSSAGGGGAAF